ncbi:MAG TPA: hypothetical protein PLI62_00245 [Spirochaetota bacterium]|nr:hypothetical protein [Spirochaetota bacterium]
MIDYRSFDFTIEDWKTASDYRLELGGGDGRKGGISLEEFQIPLMIECFIEADPDNGIMKISEIERMFYIHVFPLLRSREKCRKIAIVNEILYRFSDSKRKETRFKDGKIARGVQGIRIKENPPSPSDILRIYFRLFDEKIKRLKESNERRSRAMSAYLLEKNREKREAKEAAKLLDEKTKIKTPYEIVGPCPGEDSSFSAFDYLRKKPIIGWDSPEKQEWFRKIMREISKR